MPFPELTKGAVDRMMNEAVQEPVLQVLGTRLITNQTQDGAQRHRLLISDGEVLNSFAMVATQLNPLIESNQLPEYSIVRVDRYICSQVNRRDKPDKKVVIILEMEVLVRGDKVGERLGNPTQMNQYGSDENRSDSQNTQKKAAPTPAAAPVPQKRTLPPQVYAVVTEGLPKTASGEVLTHPISSLSPYQNRWTIRARVTSKSNIRTWSNSKGEGKLFSMDLADESGEIRCTAFKEQCDKYYNMIEVDKVYYITRCQLKSANKQYSTLKNDYEMTMTNDTEVTECYDNSCQVPEMQYNFVNIHSIADIEDKAVIDVIGVVKTVGDTHKFTAKASGRELTKREVTLVDKSNSSVVFTLWGSDAENFPQYENPIVLLKGARVTEFGGGKTLGMIGGTVMKKNPDIPEAHSLRAWFDKDGGDNAVSVSTRNAAGASSYSTEWLTFRETLDRNLGAEKADYFQSVAMVHNIKTGNAVYKACPNKDCNKKVTDLDNGQYRCDKCNHESYDFKYRLLVNMLIGDWTSNRWVTMFSELAEQMLGKSSQDIGEMIEASPDNAEKLFSSINFHEFMFKIRAKAENYADATRTKYNLVNVQPINYKEYNAYLIKNIKEATGINQQ